MQLLSTLVANHSTRNSCGGVVDSAIQTSPGLVRPFVKVQPDSQLEGHVPPCCQPQCTQQSDVSSWHPRGSSIAENSKSSQRGHRRTRRRPLLIPKRRKSTICAENSQLLIEAIKKDVSSPLKEICNEAAAAHRKGVSVIHRNGARRANGRKALVSPFSPWSQDSNSSVCVAGTEPTIEPPQPKREIPEKARGLWQLFDMHCDSDSIIAEVWIVFWEAPVYLV